LVYFVYDKGQKIKKGNQVKIYILILALSFFSTFASADDLLLKFSNGIEVQVNEEIISSNYDPSGESFVYGYNLRALSGTEYDIASFEEPFGSFDYYEKLKPDFERKFVIFYGGGTNLNNIKIFIKGASDEGSYFNNTDDLREALIETIGLDDFYSFIIKTRVDGLFYVPVSDTPITLLSVTLVDWFIDPGTLPDTDNDGVLNTSDNCPLIANTGQANNDGDSEGDACDADDDNDSVLDTTDNCQFTSNPTQDDGDADGQGDVCDGDIDGDTVANADDNCPVNPNADQLDTDADGYGDDCDTDDDNDTVLDADDNCVINANTDQSDLPDNDGIGDVCDADDDNDSYLDNEDNCPINANSGQEDADNDGAGNACDNDDDGDSILDVNDNCPLTPNFDQNDQDGDGQGDVCDGDIDADGIANGFDNCPVDANASQDDFDNDNVGDACDSDIDGDKVLNGSDICLMTPIGGIVDPGNGCTIAQLCPCTGPRGVINDWRNHGKYISCTAKTAENFVDLGLIVGEQKDVIVSEAAQSECGVKTKN